MAGIHFYRFKFIGFSYKGERYLYSFKISYIFLSLLLFIQLGCIKLNINIPSEPDLILDYISIVKTVNENYNFVKPVKDDFISIKDNRIYAVIKVRNLGVKLDLVWMWYNPSKKLVKSSEKISVNIKKKYLEYFIGWDSLENDFLKKNIGEWTVIVRSNNILIGKKNFKVNKKSQN